MWYALGGELPLCYREWVLHDATARTWLLRHIARAALRTTIPLLAAFVGLYFLGGPLWLILLALLLGLLTGLYIAASYATESVDARLQHYGYPAGFASGLRELSRAGEHAREDAVRANLRRR
jgi:hypothetical protein